MRCIRSFDSSSAAASWRRRYVAAESADASAEMLYRADEFKCIAGEGVTSGSKTCEMDPNPSGESMALRQGLGGISIWLMVGEVGPENGAATSYSILSSSPWPSCCEALRLACSHDRMDMRRGSLEAEFAGEALGGLRVGPCLFAGGARWDRLSVGCFSRRLGVSG